MVFDVTCEALSLVPGKNWTIDDETHLVVSLKRDEVVVDKL